MKIKIIILTLIIFVANGCAINLAKEQHNNLKPIALNDFSSQNVEIKVNAEKSVYHSEEEILVSIEIFSQLNLNDVVVTVVGLTDNFGRDYFNQSQQINLRPNAWQKIDFSQKLPVCNTCSGLRPGNYTLRVFVSKQAQVLAQREIYLQIKQ